MTTEYGAAPLNLNLTTALAEFLARVEFDSLPEDVRHEGRRGVLDWLGCAIAGSTHPTITRLLNVLTALNGAPTATVIGDGRRLGLLEAPIANGQMGHVLDYDDTHMDGVILHASSPVLAALLALAETRRVSGAAFLRAYAIGFEVGVRAGQSAPRHHEGGWHLTGTLGTLAAASACGSLLGLDARQLVHTMGIAGTQAAGMQQNRGTMCKSFHAGKAASNGVLSALLAAEGFDSSDEILEGKRGFSRIYSVEQDVDRLLDGLGERWLITTNGYKPYACGVVQHALIDAMILAAEQCQDALPSVERVVARVNPRVVRITGVEDPQTGLKSKFSLKHSAAVAFLDGNAGIPQYSDARATADDVVELRSRIEVVAEPEFGPNEAAVDVWLTGGQHISARIPHASGTAENPLSDAAIERKFLSNAVPVLGDERARAVIAEVAALDRADDVSQLMRLLALAGT
ncbi:MAG: MmgE/PrpD family protein [Pseudomonadota bacterium]